MYKIAIIGVLVVEWLSQVHTIRIDTRIVNGEIAVKNQFPFYVKLLIIEKKGQHLLTRHECGGTLISENCVVTAAHCLDFKRKIIVSARLGFYNANDTMEQQKYISRAHFIHENFSRRTYENDIGLVLLATNVQFTNAVQAIPMSCEYTQPNTAIQVIGNGLLNYDDDDLPSQLRWTNLTTITNTECEESYDDIFSTVICAQSDFQRNRSTCLGDSGGPAVHTINGTVRLIALISFGPIGTCSTGTPNGLTRIGNYSDWIAEKTEHSVKCA